MDGLGNVDESTKPVVVAFERVLDKMEQQLFRG
jgi:hypothetical protein